MTKLAVAFFREIIGYVDTAGPEHNWESTNTPLARFLEGSHPGEKPNTFRYLQAEGWLAGVMSGRAPKTDEEAEIRRRYMEEGIRFLSNLTIVKAGSTALEKIEIDTLQAKLADCTRNGVFTGRYTGPAAPGFTPAFESDVAELWNHQMMPKFSGAQIKIPVSLLPDADGGHVIAPAVQRTFSHILKVPREGFYASLPAVEWMGLELSRRAGLETAAHALVEMPDGMAPSLIVERFDIPEVNDDLRRVTRISDFCNITNRPPTEFNKYNTDIAVCFEELEKQSSNPEADRMALFKKLVLSVYIRDGDAHLKNISVLKTFDRETGDINVRFAPVYDSMTTAIYPTMDDREAALLYYPEGVKESLGQPEIFRSRHDLLSIARTNGIPEEVAEAVINHIAQSILDNAIDIARNPPEIFKNHPACLHALKCVTTEIVMRSDAPKPSDWGAESYEDVFSWEYEEESTLQTTTLAFNGKAPAQSKAAPVAAIAPAPSDFVPN